MAPAMRPSDTSVSDHVAALDDPVKQADSVRLIEIMGAATGEPAVLWAGSIIGFGRYHYRYASGREGDAPLVAFSPRKAAISLYVDAPGDRREDLLGRLGRHRSGAACVYVKRLADVDEAVVAEFVAETVALARAQHVD